MNQTRQALVETLKNLKKDWKNAIKTLYPEAHSSILNNYQEAICILKRSIVEENVLSSSQWDVAAIVITNSTPVDTLYDFLKDHVGKDRIFNLEQNTDPDDYPDFYCNISEYVKESDTRYLRRLKDLQERVNNANKTKEQQIEELKAQLRALEAE